MCIQLGFAANTPNELMTLCGKMKDHYEILKDHVSSLRMANAALRVEQDHLVCFTFIILLFVLCIFCVNHFFCQSNWSVGINQIAEAAKL